MQSSGDNTYVQLNQELFYNDTFCYVLNILYKKNISK